MGAFRRHDLSACSNEEARRNLPRVHVVAVTASPAILAERLKARGRAQDGDLAIRLLREVRTEADETVVDEGDHTIAASLSISVLRDRTGGA